MFKCEYFSNSYRVLITKKPIHTLIILLEYIITFIPQVNQFTLKFSFKSDENPSDDYFYAIFIQNLNKLPEFIKLLITTIIFIAIIIYFFIYTKYSFENRNLFNIITINIFEIFIFRLLLIAIFHILLSIKGAVGIIMILLSIPVTYLISNNFILSHLYYFSPHFIEYPYDYYSSLNDIFHIAEKILISISSQSSNKPFNQFLFITTYVLQILNLILSIYIFNNKSYFIMNNVLLNKVRFSLVTSSVIINSIILLIGNKNFMIYTFLLVALNIFLAVFIIIVIFYNPYTHAYFSTDDNTENLYFYNFIIDRLRNDSFILEEKIRKHFMLCQKCNLCKNLKNYLTKKKCYKMVYKILYNKVGVLEHTMNELIHTVLINGKEALKNNSFFLINLMYCYYINLKKQNYVLSLNLKLLFEIINLENKNILENHLLSTEQILLINDFLAKSDNILDKIKLILTETIIKEKVNYFFSLFEQLFQLKSKQFKTKLYYNKNEGIINFFKYISICSMIYEEIFNVSLSSGGMTLKENQIFLDDISNKNSLGLNQIIIQLDLLNFENNIIYITGDLAKYKGKHLCQLFPNIFKTQQLLIMKNKIMNSKFLSTINKDKDFFINSNKKKNNEEQYIHLQLLIYDEVEHKKYFVMISLRLNLIYPLNIAKKILLTGFYSVDKNIIVTLDKSTNESKKEIVLNPIENKYESEIRNYASNEIELIKYKKNDRYYNMRKLLFVTKFYVNPNCYNIYSIFHTEKQRTYKMDKIMEDAQKNNNIYDIESKNNMYAGGESTQNFNFMMMSQTSSTFNQISNDVQGFKKRDKGGKKDSKKTYFFRYYQFGLIFLSFFVLLFEIITHIILYKSLGHLTYKNSAFTYLRNFYGVANNAFSITLVLSCLADSPYTDKCGTIITDFSRKKLGPQRPGPPFSFNVFLYQQNKGLSNPLGTVRQIILKILSNSEDESIYKLINSQMTNIIISQNISQEGTKLYAIKQNDSFIDVLNYITTSFMVLSSDDSALNDPIYILKKINIDDNWIITDEPFEYVKINGQLTKYQYNFYYLILNYIGFVKKLDVVSDGLIDSTFNTIRTNVRLIKIIILIIFFVYIILQGIIYFYIQTYYKILAVLFNDIEKKLDLKNDDISVREMFLQKIEKLKIIITLYKQDIYQAIVDLNFIYDNYKKFIEEKNKEIAKYLKKEKYLNEKAYNIPDKNQKIIQKHISSIKENRIYLYYIVFCSVISIAITITLFVLWNSYESIFNRITYLISSHGNLTNDVYKILNYYQLMFYYSLTIADINEYEQLDTSKGEDLFHQLYKHLEDLYESKKYMTNLKSYNLDNIDKYFNFTCESFYAQAYNSYAFLINYPFSGLYRQHLIKICEDSNILKSSNYKHIFGLLFEMIQLGMNQVTDYSYEGLISYVKSEQYTNATVAFLFFYLYTFEILAFRVQRQSFENLMELIDSYLLTGFIIHYTASFIFIMIIIFVYIFKFNRNYHELHDMKKVFKICNKRE